MDIELFLIHLFFISACVYFSYKSGEKQGRVQMINDMIDRKIITISKLKSTYEID